MQIETLNEIFRSTELTPCAKLVSVQLVISAFPDSMTQSKKGFTRLEKGDLLSILIYCLVKANIPDLRSQMTLITEFTSGFIQDGHSRISATFTDL